MIKSNSYENILTLLSSRDTRLKKEEKDLIINLIFPNSETRKAKKLERLKRNLLQIKKISDMYRSMDRNINKDSHNETNKKGV